MSRRKKSERRPLVRRPLVGFEQLEARDVPATAFALSGTNLLSFDTATPAITQSTPITGVSVGETLVGIDFRAQNGLLYGLGVDHTTDKATLYAISARTGVAGVVGGTSGLVTFTTDGTTVVDLPDPATVGYGIDFNPAADRFRVVAGSLNFRVNPNTGTGVDGDNTGLTMGGVTGTNPDGPINDATTTVDAAAYTNNEPNTTVTTQYTLDAASNSLFIQSPPNTGKQALVATVTLGGNSLDFTAINGFDIAAGVNDDVSGSGVAAGSGLAVLNFGGKTGLYSIDLTNAQAKFVGNVGTGALPVSGFAVQNEYTGHAAIGLDSTATSLVRFNTATPGTVTTKTLDLTAVVSGETLVGIDFRPATGQLYALGIDSSTEKGSLYLVDPQTGVVSLAVAGKGSAITFASTDFPAASAGYGIDFNPDVDRLRVTTGTGLNFRVNPNTAVPVARDTDISGSGVTGVSATAYTNAFGNDVAVTATTQYTIDAASDSLYIQGAVPPGPNGGVQSNPLSITVGGTPIDFTAVNGFDIPAGVRVSTSGQAVTSGFGFASLTVGATTSLYKIDLTTGAATNLGAVGAGTTGLTGFTLADTPAGSVAFTSATTSISESGPTVTVMLTRTGSLTGAVNVTVNATGGTAVAGDDFVAGPYTATFADGATTAMFTIALTDDAIFEGNETIVLTLASADNAAVITTPNVTTITITENDPQQTFTVPVATGFALVGSTLVPFASTNPSAAGAAITITNVDASETLVAIDFRPQNGQLYGLGINATANTGTLYAISTATGRATPVSAAVGAIAFVDGGGTPIDLPDPATVNYDIDINPAVDRLRVVAGTLNFRVDPNTGMPIDGVAGGLINPDGNINGDTTTVNGTAYTNAFPNNGGVTTQYTLDATNDKLFIQNPPNNGTQASGVGITLGGTTLDFTAVKGFDILADVNAPGANMGVMKGTGLAVLSVGGTDSLYSIDLFTGAATLVGGVGTTPATVTSIAFQSDLGATPTIALNSTGTRLVRSLSNNVANPFQVTIAGITSGESLVGIDFRPQTGQLFGLGIDGPNDKGTLYRIDPQTGVATVIGTPSQVTLADASGVTIDLPPDGYGFDFNPTVDKIRVTTASGLNFRIAPITGAVVDTNGATGNQGDANINGSGVTGVSAAAYTNSFGQSGLTVTTQYTLDATSNSLYIQNQPNQGTQTLPITITLGGNPLNFTDVNGFNIGSNVRAPAANMPVTSGSALAALTVGVTPGLYSIDLVTGVAKILGTAPGSLTGLTTAATPAGVIEFTAATFSGSEANSTLDLTLTRTGGTNGEVTVMVSLASGTAIGGTDFTSTAIPVTFADGATTAKASVPITAETIFEGDETFAATLGSATNGAVIGAVASSTVTITNDDPQPTITIADAKVLEGNTGTTPLAFTVSLTNPSDQMITVMVDSADATAIGGKDFTAVVGQTVTFMPGETTQMVTVDLTGEAIFETDETFSLTLSNAVGATLGMGTTATGTITNDDAAPVLTIGDVSVTEGDSGTATATFTITVTGASEVDGTVQVDTTNGTATAGKDYSAIVGQVISLPAGTTSKTFTVEVNGETTFETDETFTLTLSNPTNATNASHSTATTATGTITNDDPMPTVSIGNATVTEGNSGSVTATFTITLSAASEVPATVTVATMDATAKAGSDYTAIAGTVLNFAPGVTTQTVDVTINGDTVNEANEFFNLVLSAPTGATLGTAAKGTGMITNDDAAPTLSISDAAVSEGNAGTTPATFTITLTGATEQTVMVDVTTANNTATAGADFTALAPSKITLTTLTFAPGETTKTVTVNVTGDTTVENDETYFVVLSNPIVGVITDGKGFGTIVNDDNPPPAAPSLLVGSPVTAIGVDSGTPTVRVIDANGNQLSSFTGLPTSFTGGALTTVADVNGDGTPDIVVGSGPGSVSLVRVVDGVTGKELFSAQPFETSFTGGVFVAAGDVNGDRLADVVVSADQGGGARVDVFSGKNFDRIDTFLGIEDPDFRGGARVAVGDIDGDGIGDIAVAAGFLGGPRVAAFNGKSIGTGTRVKLFNDIFVFEDSVRNGAFIALGDVDGDGKADLVAGGGPTGGPRVRAISGAVLVSSNGTTQTELANFFAGDPNSRTGVRVAVKDLDGDTKADIRTVVGGSNTIVTYLGKDLTPTGTPPSSSMEGIPDDAFNGGVFVG